MSIKNFIFKQKKKKFKSEEDRNINLFTFWVIFFYFIIYYLFAGKGFISSGIDLEKKDWLSFFGAYLSFASTLFVCYISLSKDNIIFKNSELRAKEERFKQIQPIFAINVITANMKKIGSQAEIDKLTKLNIKEFKFTLKNLGEFPILHLRVFNQYLIPSLASGESIDFYCVYDIRGYEIKGSDKHIKIPIPTNGDIGEPPYQMVVQFYDVDGNSIMHDYQLLNYHGVEFYFLLSQKDLLNQ